MFYDLREATEHVLWAILVPLSFDVSIDMTTKYV